MAKGVTLPNAVLQQLNEIIQMYKPGGSYGAGLRMDLARGQQKSVASGMQALVSSGLANTTQAAGLANKYQEEVAAPALASLEERRAQLLGTAMQGRASYLNQLRQEEIVRNQRQYQRNQQILAQNRANRVEADAWLDQWMQKGRIGGGRSYGARRTTGGTVGNPVDFSNTPTIPYGISNTPAIPMAQGYGPYGPGTYVGAGAGYKSPYYR